MVCGFRDADDAVYGRDGYDYDGYRLRVEFPRSGRGSRGGFGGIGGAPRGRYGPPSRRSEYRVLVSGKRHFFHKCTLFEKPKRCTFVSLTAFFFLTDNEILCWREMVKADLQRAAFDMVIFFFVVQDSLRAAAGKI